MKNNEERQTAIIAAKWWTKAIANPTMNHFSNGEKTDNQASLLMLLGYVNSTKHRASEIQLSDFQTYLSKRINDELDKENEVELDCEYDPCAILDEIATIAHVHTSLFPFKRKMRITADSVEVQDGYNAKWVTIYPKN